MFAIIIRKNKFGASSSDCHDKEKSASFNEKSRCSKINYGFTCTDNEILVQKIGITLKVFCLVKTNNKIVK